MDLKNIMSKLGGDIEGLTKEYEQVSGVLSRFGLSE